LILRIFRLIRLRTHFHRMRRFFFHFLGLFPMNVTNSL
jgi:hypothetical protein